MRTCPTCQRQYLDAQNNCQFDGTPLPPPSPASYYPPPGQYQQAPPQPGMNPMPPPPPGYQPPGYPPPQPGWQGYPPPQPAYPMGAGQFAPCPTCRRTDAEKVGFTWWGGLIGPRMLSHVKCRGCGTSYNGKSGKSNTTGIVIYSIVIFAIALTVVLVIALSR